MGPSQYTGNWQEAAKGTKEVPQNILCQDIEGVDVWMIKIPSARTCLSMMDLRTHGGAGEG